MILSYINKYHPEFGGADLPKWYDYHLPDSIEGGDMLVLSPKTVAIGCSARTSAEAIEVLAEISLRGLHPLRKSWSSRYPLKEPICILIRYLPWWIGINSLSTPVYRMT
jgi:hypothetical protein